MSELARIPFPRSSIPRQIREARKRQAAAQTPAPEESSRIRAGVAMPAVPLAQAEREWRAWFQTREWKPFDYQERAWAAYGAGKSGLILLPTGSGKTYAALGGPLQELRAEGAPAVGGGLRIIYISPLKALARDLQKAIEVPLADLGWNFSVESRTGDTDPKARRRQKQKLPHILLTTPESLGLLLTEPDWALRVRDLRAIVIDEWHELLGNKRGSLLELMLARLRSAAPRLRTWAVSATIANPELAAEVAIGSKENATIVRGQSTRPIEIHSILPREGEDLAWFGHYGLQRAPEVAAELDAKHTTLIFTNTRAQAERWYAALQAHVPAEQIGLHHGSLDREARAAIEDSVKAGKLPFVVATSSLDLGVDFPTVEKVIQIGSVKGVVRATQRAGRAFHRPGESTSLTVCPTHFLEYLEVAALRRAIARGETEERRPLEKPLDVLVQFVLSSALGDGFRPEELARTIRGAYSFRDVSDAELEWVLQFSVTGGHTLRAYPQYRKLAPDEQGVYRFVTPRLARWHRMNMGTIVGESGVPVRFLRGSTLGQIDESFIARLKPRESFYFAGRALELVRYRDLVAYVRLARKAQDTVPTVWGGQSLPISPALSEPMRELLDSLTDPQKERPPELQTLGPTLDIQRKRSAIPRIDETLVERIDTREGHHLFLYTWEGRAVNEGLGHLLAYRIARGQPNTIAVSANDHGLELLATREFPADDELRAALCPGPNLETEIEHSLNYVELAKRAFREIARVSGLIQVGPPSERKTTRNLQISASLLFDVFRQHDPHHPLLREAFAEVKRAQLDFARLKLTLERIAGGKIVVKRPERLTPFSFPLFIDRIRSRVSTESLEDRIARFRKKAFAP